MAGNLIQQTKQKISGLAVVITGGTTGIGRETAIHHGLMDEL